MINETNQHRQKRFWNKTKKRRSPDHPIVSAFAEPKIKLIRDYIEKSPEDDKIKTILDVGCGNGFFTRPLSRWANCTAMDFSEKMLELNPVDCTKICGDACNMSFDDNSFDLVFCSNLLHHIANPLVPILEMKRVSSKYIVISEPNRNNPLMFAFGLIKSVERGTLKFSPNYLKKLASQSGLKPLHIQSMGSILPNKTPKSLLWIFKLIDGAYPLAFYNIMICSKNI
ncbi:MAG: methyltransferase domain-containing protein [Planctomycetes bacterium]|nr:methyltransferase domain-containing protein [Planctomycetota bacterium]